MARAHLFRPITDREGNLLYNATVTVRETDYAVPIGQALYASATGSTVLPNPFTTANGVIDLWLDVPQRMSILVEAAGVQDILVYQDAPVPPEETVATTSPLKIVNTPSTSGLALLSTGTPGQVQWGTPPTGTGLTPVVVASSQSFNSGFDPAGWTLATGSATTRSYDPSTIPPGTNYFYSLHGRATANNGVLTITGPTFTLLESGALSLWMKTSFAGTENFTVKVTDTVPVTTTLATIASTREWGFYSYNLPPGTYTPKFTYTGPAVWAAGAHDVWMTGYVARYGGLVPPHNHPGTGASSVALGTSSTAAGDYGTAVGVGSTASGTNATAYGYGAQSTGNSSLALGTNAVANADFALAAGANASGSPSTTAWTAVGYNSTASGLESVAVGKAASSTGDYATAVGSSASSTGASAVAVGKNAHAFGASSVALGNGASVGPSHANSVALGANSATTGANQVMLGNEGAMTIIPGSLQNYGLVSLGKAGSRVGFYGSAGAVQQVVSGSDDGNQTLRSLVQALATMGLIVNSSLQQPAAFSTPVGVVDYFYRQDAGDGTLGVSDFDFANYTYAPLAFSATGPYPSGPQWYVGTDHNGYKGVATGLGALKNTYRSNHGVEFGAFIQPASTGNKICVAVRHGGQTDGTAAAAYLVLDQAAGTIALGVKTAGASLSTAYTVAGGNSRTLSSLGLTPFDGAVHRHQVYISGQTVVYIDGSSTLKTPVYFYDPALHLTGTSTGVDFNSLTALNTVTLLPMASYGNFRTTGALTNTASGEVWQTATSGAGAAVTVSAPGNLQTIGGTAGYALAYFLAPLGAGGSTGKIVQTQYTGTIQATSGITGRIQDATNYYLVNTTNVTKVVAGTQTVLGSAHSSTFVTGDTMQVAFGPTGVIQVYRNGLLVNSVTDTTFTAQNRFGLGIRAAATANWPYLFVTDTYNSAVVYK